MFVGPIATFSLSARLVALVVHGVIRMRNVGAFSGGLDTLHFSRTKGC